MEDIMIYGAKAHTRSLAVFLAVAQDSCLRRFPNETCLRKRRFTQAQLLAFVLLREHLGLGIRGLTELLRTVKPLRAALGVTSAPSTWSLIEARKRAGRGTIESLLEEVLRGISARARAELDRVRAKRVSTQGHTYYVQKAGGIWRVMRIRRDGQPELDVSPSGPALRRLPLVMLVGSDPDNEQSAEIDS